MVSHIVEARHVSGHTLWPTFSNGAEGEVDLGAEVHGEVFEPLNDPSYFQSFQVHPEFKTVVWPNGADFAPEFLRAELRVVTQLLRRADVLQRAAPASGRRS